MNSLGRSASANELSSYAAVSASGALSDAAIYSTISNSQEANLIADPVIRFYQAAFGRVPDQAGLQNAESFVRAATPTAATYQNLAAQFTQTQEFTNRYGAGTTVDAAFVQSLYTNILGRQGSAAEIAGYTSGSNGYTTRAQVFYAISQSQEAINITDTAVNNFEFAAAQGTASYTGPLPGLNAVTNTVNLTTGVDNLIGTQNGDSYNALLGGANGTLNPFDTIQDQGGTNDVLNIVVQAGAIIPAGTKFSGIETINVDETGSLLGGALDASAFQGSTLINQAGTAATGVVSVTNVSALQTVAFTGAEKLANGAGDITLAANVASATVQLNSVGDGSTVVIHEAAGSAGTLTTETINGSLLYTGAATKGTLTIDTDATATGLTTLNLGLTSNETVTLSANVTKLVTFNAAASTGNLTVDLSAEKALATATLGSGNDTVTDSLAAKTASLITYNSGAGNDQINFNATGSGTGNHAASFTLGAGTDTLSLTTKISNLNSATNDANINANLITVQDFNAGSGGDVLNLATAAVANGRVAVTTSGAGNEQSAINAATTLKAALDIVASATDGAGKFQVFDYQGSAYVYVENHAAAVAGATTTDTVQAGDGLVKVVGVTAAQLDAAHLTVA